MLITPPVSLAGWRFRVQQRLEPGFVWWMTRFGFHVVAYCLPIQRLLLLQSPWTICEKRAKKTTSSHLLLSFLLPVPFLFLLHLLSNESIPLLTRLFPTRCLATGRKCIITDVKLQNELQRSTTSWMCGGGRGCGRLLAVAALPWKMDQRLKCQKPATFENVYGMGNIEMLQKNV